MVTEHPIKYGQICTNGLGCTTGGDRSLGDFLQVTPTATGAALVSYVDDTSADTASGENAGPVNVSRQISGAEHAERERSRRRAPSRIPFDQVTDPSGDAFFSALGQHAAAGDNLDLIGASLTDGPGNTLVAKINVKSLASLAVSPTVGGPDASWIIRWTYVTPGQTGNGHIYYAGMDNAGTGTPTFFDGDTSCIPPPGNAADHCKYMTFPQTHGRPRPTARVRRGHGIITLKVPLADVGNPPSGGHAVQRHGIQRDVDNPAVGHHALQPHRCHLPVRPRHRVAGDQRSGDPAHVGLLGAESGRSRGGSGAAPGGSGSALID